MSFTCYNSDFGNMGVNYRNVGPGPNFPNPGTNFPHVNPNNFPHFGPHSFPNLGPNNFPNFAPTNFPNAGTMYSNIPHVVPTFQNTPPPPLATYPNGVNISNGNVGSRLRNNSVGQEGATTGTNQNSEDGYEWQNPNVLLYIDNSNIFESAKKHSGHKKGYRNGIPDVACRIDIGKLISMAVKGRGLVFGKLYGSEPPALDTVWEAIRRKQVHVETFQRSKWTLKEKETDSSLTADAVEDIIMEKDQAGKGRTVVLFSGDRDLLRVVDKAINHGYRVEIWSFKSSINNTVIRKANAMPEQVVVNSIDDIFDEITYTKVLWGKKTIPRERSLVASVRLPVDCDKKKTLTSFVAKAGETFQLPMMGKYMDNYKYILLVPCIKEHYTPQPCQGKSKSEQATVRTYNFYKHIQPFMHQLQEHFQSICSDVKSWLEFINSRNPQSSLDILSSTRFQKLQIDDDDDEPKEDDGEEIDDEDLLMSDDESEDFDCNDFFDAHHEDIDDDFIPFVRKEGRPRRMYSAYCTYKFWCAKGSDCSYKHTEQQKEFFKREPDAKKRRLYKIKPCYHNCCQYQTKSYLCAYAHSLSESRCICCKEKGSGQHWMDQCPYNRYTNNNTDK